MKRLFDIVLSSIMLIMLSPFLVLIAFSIAIGSRGGVLFHQTRVGMNGREFNLLKFRSMRPGSEEKGQITVGERDPRITPIGRSLRRYKLDELPQLINVLKGEMSIVGPRPEVPKYVSIYTEEQRGVLTVRPGLTSLASIAYINENEILGRSRDPERTYREEVLPAKLALDLEYVRRRSLLLDLKIIFRTFGRMISG